MLRYFILLVLFAGFSLHSDAQSTTAIWGIDFVKCRADHRAEMLFYYQNNWKVYRDSMLERGFISAYEILETKADSAGNFDLILMTCYPDSMAWKESEAHFAPIMKAIRPDTSLLLNDLKANDFRSLVFFKTAKTLFASPALPTVNIANDALSIAALKAINRDIWLPFIDAYHRKNPEKYIALHAADFIRANGGKSLHTADLSAYAKGVRASFARYDKNIQVDIDFSFFERMASNTTSSERGIYKLIYTLASGEKELYYGRFHVFHRKIGGKWKIAVDYDTDDGEKIGETQFKAGKKIAEL